MLRGILNRALAGRRRPAGAGMGTMGGRRPASRRGAAGGGSNREIERGAKSILRGLSRRRRGL